MSDRPGEPDRQNQLAELLACERELERLLAAAREEARRTVEDARTAAAEAEADLESTLAAEAGRIRSTVEGQTQARIQEIHTRSREQAARYEGVSDEEVERLAEQAFRRFIARDGHS